MTDQIRNKVAPLLTPRRREIDTKCAPIPPEWESTVAACLAKDPAHRPESVDEVAELLGVEQRSRTKTKTALRETTIASSPSVRETKEQEVGRKKSMVPLIAAVAGVVALLGIIAAFYFGSRSRRETSNQEQPQPQLQPAAQVQASTPKPVEAPNPRGAVLVQTEPAGAIVVLGEESRKSPATFNRLKVGSFPIKVERDGYEPVEKTVTVEENSVTEVPLIKLVRSTGRARIETKPAGIKFDLVDADAAHHTGTSPADLANIPIGMGRIVFKPETGPNIGRR